VQTSGIEPETSNLPS